MIALPVELPAETVEAIVSAVTTRVLAMIDARPHPTSTSPYMTIPEAAEYLCCSRQRIDDLLSQRRLSRHKDGRRTLVSRVELDGYIAAIAVKPR